MSNSKRLNLVDIIQGISKPQSIEVIPARVDSVDESKMTLNASPLDGSAELYNVRLQSVGGGVYGFVALPTVGASVLIVTVRQGESYVIGSEQVDKVLIEAPQTIINGGANGGLINIESLVERVNNLETKLQQMIDVYDIHTHPTSAPGAPTGPTVVVIGATVGQTKVSDLEDTKVKH